MLKKPYEYDVDKIKVMITEYFTNVSSFPFKSNLSVKKNTLTAYSYLSLLTFSGLCLKEFYEYKNSTFLYHTINF